MRVDKTHQPSLGNPQRRVMLLSSFHPRIEPHAYAGCLAKDTQMPFCLCNWTNSTEFLDFLQGAQSCRTKRCRELRNELGVLLSHCKPGKAREGRKLWHGGSGPRTRGPQPSPWLKGLLNRFQIELLRRTSLRNPSMLFWFTPPTRLMLTDTGLNTAKWKVARKERVPRMASKRHHFFLKHTCPLHAAM